MAQSEREGSDGAEAHEEISEHESALAQLRELTGQSAMPSLAGFDPESDSLARDTHARATRATRASIKTLKVEGARIGHNLISAHVGAPASDHGLERRVEQLESSVGSAMELLQRVATQQQALMDKVGAK